MASEDARLMARLSTCDAAQPVSPNSCSGPRGEHPCSHISKAMPDRPDLLPCALMRVPVRALVCGVALLAGQDLSGQRIETPMTVIDHPSAQRVVKLEFGLKAAEPAHWTGQAAVSTGTIHSAWGWNFNRPDRIVGAAGWDLHTRAFNPEGAPYRFRTDLPGGVRILPNGILPERRSTPLGPFHSNHHSRELSIWTGRAGCTGQARNAGRRGCSRGGTGRSSAYQRGGDPARLSGCRGDH